MPRQSQAAGHQRWTPETGIGIAIGMAPGVAIGAVYDSIGIGLGSGWPWA